MHPASMEPVLPPHGGAFESVAVVLHREASALAASAHPITMAALAGLVRIVNSFYSNLIEGIRTTPAEIEAAIKTDYSHDPGRAALQRLAVSHIRVEEAVAFELASNPELPVTTPDFLRRLHRDLYADVPDSERVVRSFSGREAVVRPGEFRGEDITIGRHNPPPSESLTTFLARFHEAYRPDNLSEVRRVLAFAASHHRLAWIHPFLDGNGRVARLFTTAYARRIGLDANGLWSIARGFARRREEYYQALAGADGSRTSALDGRGNLSLAGLEAWCDFVVRVALDQIEYMRSLLKPDTLADRLRTYSAHRMSEAANAKTLPGWRTESGELLADLVSRGMLSRKDALAYFPKGERTARAALSVLLKDGILEAETHRSGVRLAFPPHAAVILFPDLMTTPSRL